MDPFTIAALAASIGGTYMQNQAANQAAAARTRALTAERQRQSEMQRQQSQAVDAEIANMGKFGADEEERRIDLTQYFTAPTEGDANAQAGMIAPEGSSDVLVNELNRQNGISQDRNARNAAGLAGIRSFGDVMGDRMVSLRRTAGDIDQLSSFRRGSQDASLSEIDAAAHAGAGKQMIGDVLSGLGSIGMGYANYANAGTPAVSDFVARLTGQPTSLAPTTTLRPMARPNMLG